MFSASLAAAKLRDSSLRSSAGAGEPPPAAASSVAPIAVAIEAPCVLASLAYRSPEKRQHPPEEH
jgi:hypothetical protein